MNTPSGYLENIRDIDAGYGHSLAIVDVNGTVLLWGKKLCFIDLILFDITVMMW
jgi:hypothetical protein